MRKKPKKEWVFEFNSHEAWALLFPKDKAGTSGRDEWKSVYRMEPHKKGDPVLPRCFTLAKAIKELTTAYSRVKDYRYRLRNVETGEIIPMEIFS